MTDKSEFGLGVIEGFYGGPWSQTARLHYCHWLPASGYDFYIYAPKADEVLRKNWRDEWDRETLACLKEQRAAARESGLAFGIGFSPFEIYRNYDAETKTALLKKVRYIDAELAPDIFCALFDDMHGEQLALARLQANILADIAAVTHAKKLVLCPTYYSLDPVLENLFGPRPEDYFDILGREVESAVDIFWTGERICSTEYPAAHLEMIAGLLKRKPLIWDNYPVNDVREMCNFLNLKPYTNRPATLRDFVSGHVANPMKQPWLSQMPLASLPLSYQRGENYQPAEVLRETALACFGPELGEMLLNDIEAFQERGLEALSNEELQQFKARYTPFADSGAAKEVLNWLHGEYRFDDTIFAA